MPRNSLSTFHADGVEYMVMLPAADVDQAIDRLRICHDHVFIVDQSYGRNDQVGLGVSARGLLCLQEEFPTKEFTP